MPRVPPPVDTRPTQVVETPIDSTLAERLLSQLVLQAGMGHERDRHDEAIELINLAFLEAQADVVLNNCAELTLTGVEPRFTGQHGEATHTLLGPLPPVGTLWISPQGQKFFIASHKEST